MSCKIYRATQINSWNNENPITTSKHTKKLTRQTFLLMQKQSVTQQIKCKIVKRIAKIKIDFWESHTMVSYNIPIQFKTLNLKRKDIFYILKSLLPYIHHTKENFTLLLM